MRFLGGSCSCRIRVLGDLRRSFGLRLAQSGHLDAEAVFNELGVCDDEGVLGWKASVGPGSCFIAGLQAIELVEKTIPQLRGRISSQNGAR